MYKCLKITFDARIPEGFLQSFIQKNAKKLDLEGVAQHVDGGKKVKVVVCGAKENVDTFLDILHKGSGNFNPEKLEVEPFLKDKDYRGVFRIIE